MNIWIRAFAVASIAMLANSVLAQEYSAQGSLTRKLYADMADYYKAHSDADGNPDKANPIGCAYRSSNRVAEVYTALTAELRVPLDPGLGKRIAAGKTPDDSSDSAHVCRLAAAYLMVQFAGDQGQVNREIASEAWVLKSFPAIRQFIDGWTAVAKNAIAENIAQKQAAKAAEQEREDAQARAQEQALDEEESRERARELAQAEQAAPQEQAQAREHGQTASESTASEPARPQEQPPPQVSMDSAVTAPLASPIPALTTQTPSPQPVAVPDITQHLSPAIPAHRQAPTSSKLSIAQILRAKRDTATSTAPAQSQSVTANADTDKADTAETQNAANGDDTLTKMILVAILATYIFLFIGGVTNKFVVFYDKTDFFISAMVFLSPFIGAVLAWFFEPHGYQDHDPPTIMMQLCTYAGYAGAALFAVWTIKLSVLHNQNIALGGLVGVFKVVTALLAFIVLIAYRPHALIR